MMRKVVKIGSSVGIILPKATLESIGIKAGDRIKWHSDRKNKALSFKLFNK
ncbi:MAG: AbrB/MazE/SpoVT family DNA-binding domain-containing protein [Patescibacteria group bacterium]